MTAFRKRLKTYLFNRSFLKLLSARAVIVISKAKAKALYSTTSLILQQQRRCATHTETAYSLGRIPSLCSRTLACSHTAYSLPFNGIHFHDDCKYVDYYIYTDPGAMEG